VNQGPPEELRQHLDTTLMALLFARAIVPAAMDLLASGRRTTGSSVSESLSVSGGISTVATIATWALTLAVLGVIAARVSSSLNRPVGRNPGLWLLVAASLGILVAPTAGGASFSPWWVFPLTVVLGLAIVPPASSVVRKAVAQWTAGLALASFAAALAVPQVALLQDKSDRFSLFAGQRLAGFTSHPNALGLFLAVGLPFVLAERKSGPMSYLPVAGTLAALVATGSRTALFAAVAALAIYWLAGNSLSRRRATRLALGSLGLISVLPLIGLVPSILVGTGRPEVWAFVRSNWANYAPFGAGPQVWSDVSIVRALNLDYAFHAHNLWLDLLMVGGVPSAVIVFLWVCSALRSTSKLRADRLVVASSALAALLVESLSEVPVYFAGIDIRLVLLIAIAVVAHEVHEPRSLTNRAYESPYRLTDNLGMETPA
jgi:hypothetical protein